MIRKLKVTVNGTAYDVVVEENGEQNDNVTQKTSTSEIKSITKEPEPVTASVGSEKIESPMPGVVVSVNVSTGQQVKKGDVLVVLEAMKMENEIMSPRDGKVASVGVSNGDTVESGTLLVSLE